MTEPFVKIMAVKFDPKARTYNVRYLTEQNGYTAELTLESIEPPRPEFDQAIANMAPDFCRLIAMTPETSKTGADPMSRVCISGVTKNIGKNSVSYSFSAKIFNPATCRYQNVSLPSVDVTSIPRDIQDHILVLFHEAQFYVQGKRAQGSMFDEERQPE